MTARGAKRPKRLTCDAGCGATRKLWARLCDSCNHRLPDEISVGILAAFQQRRWSDHMALVKRAKAWLNLHPRHSAMPVTRVSPDRSAEITRRLLGERD